MGFIIKRFLSIMFCLSTRRLRLTSNRSVSSLAQVEIQIKQCLSAAIKKPHGLLSSPLHCGKLLQTLHSRQLTRLFHSNSRQRLPLQYKWRISLRHNLPALKSIRTFRTSPAFLASNSTIQIVSERHVSDAAAAASMDNSAVAAPPTTALAEVETGTNEIANFLAESATSAPLLFPDFPFIRAAELTIQKLHEITGLPWWATITLSAITLRVVLIMPLSVYALHNAEKLSRLQQDIGEISKQLKQEVSMAMHQFKWNEEKAKDEYIKNMKRLVRDLQIKNNCHPMKSTASFWLQFPLWISVSYSLRNMTSRALSPDLDHHEECKTLTDQGALWFSDLTTTDSTWILPVLMGFVTLFNVEMTRLNVGEETKYRQRLTWFLRCLALLFIPISSTMPSAMVFYWVNSGFLAAVQNILQDYSPFKRLVGLGPSQTESSSPVKALMNKARLKYFKR